MIFDRPHNQWVARRIRDRHGLEMTPDEVDAERRAAYATIRAEMTRLGHTLPESDEELLAMIAEACRDDEDDPDADPFRDLPALTAEERRAMDGLGDDLVDRLLERVRKEERP